MGVYYKCEKQIAECISAYQLFCLVTPHALISLTVFQNSYPRYSIDAKFCTKNFPGLPDYIRIPTTVLFVPIPDGDFPPRVCLHTGINSVFSRSDYYTPPRHIPTGATPPIAVVSSSSSFSAAIFGPEGYLESLRKHQSWEFMSQTQTYFEYSQRVALVVPVDFAALPALLIVKTLRRVEGLRIIVRRWLLGAISIYRTFSQRNE